MAELNLVPTMEDMPAVCTLCHGSPTTVDGQPLPAVHAVGVDVNWGESVYICSECANIIADLFDRVPKAESDKLQKEIRRLSKDNARLDRKYKQLKKDNAKIVTGKAAERRVRRKVHA